MTSPLNCFTRLPYSDSGSQTIISSSVTRIALEISLLALKDFPLPGVPKINPLGFFSFFPISHN